MKSSIKNAIEKIADILPFGRDVFLVVMKKRLGISYRGKFDNFQQAQFAIPDTATKEYDVINKKKAANEAQELERLDNWFHDIDYPLLFWLSKLVTPKIHVLELGGSVGHFFYTSEHYHQYPDDVLWTIAELPEAAKLGTKIAQHRNEHRLRFIDSDLIHTSPASQIFITAGTLQYMNISLPELLRNLPDLPAHVLIHNLPCHSNEAFWTLQDLGICEVPYYIYSAQTLENAMSQLGYSVKAEWKNPRFVEIPFHRHLMIDGYLGFYFQRNTA